MTEKKSKKITTRLSVKMKSEMLQHMIANGYKTSEKSKWMTDAVKIFLSLPNYIDLVEHGISINQGELKTIDAFYIPLPLANTLKLATLNTRKQYPLIEGVQSAIMRASLVNKLICCNFTKLSPGAIPVTD